MLWMIWSAGPGAPGIFGARGTLEAALPGEWAALFLTLAVIAVVGAAILVTTCLRHERVVVRRHAGRAAARPGVATPAGAGGRVGSAADPRRSWPPPVS